MTIASVDRATAVLRVSLRSQVPDAWPSATAPQEARFHVFQSREFIAAWQASFGGRADVEPHFAIIADGDGLPLMMLPLALERRGGARVLTFIDQGHADYNAPVLYPGAAEIEAAAMQAAWREIVTGLGGADVVRLTKMPESVGGIANPLSLIADGPDTQSCHGNRLDRPWAEVEKGLDSPREARKKHRALSRLGSVRFITPDDPVLQDRLLETLVAMKQRRYEETGVPGFDANPDSLTFLREATAAFRRTGNLAINALMVGDEPVSVQWGLTMGRTFYALVTGYADGQWRGYSCGRILAYLLIKQCHAAGFTYFDQGVGDEAYKLRSTDTHVPLHRLVRGETARGRALVAMDLLKERARRAGLAERLRPVRRLLAQPFGKA